MNTGKFNTGHYNTGSYNTGYRNTGHYNTGYCNTGHCNTGDYNTGGSNAGCYNTGNRNTGRHNTGDCNTGYCNSVTPEDCLIFNKPAKRSDWKNVPEWMSVSPTEWVHAAYMTDKEKEAHPDYTTAGGYLKAYTSLTQAYIESWERASEEDRALTRKLPNFDEDVFEEVFGFNPWKAQKKEVTLKLTDEQLEQIKSIIGEK